MSRTHRGRNGGDRPQGDPFGACVQRRRPFSHERDGAAADEELAAPHTGDGDAQHRRPLRGLRVRERPVRRPRVDEMLPDRVRRAGREGERVEPAKPFLEVVPRRAAPPQP